MKRKRYTEKQIITILKEDEAGAMVPELARRHGVTENTILRNLVSSAALRRYSGGGWVRACWFNCTTVRRRSRYSM